jgi:DNA-binding NarL/FixJ family response regulator
MGKDHSQSERFDKRAGRLSVCVVSPSLALRAGLRALLTDIQGIDSINEASSLGDFTEISASTDILVVTAGAGTDAELREVLEASPSLAVLMLVEDEPAAVRVLSERSGRAWGILSLESSIEELEAAIHALSAGLLVGLPAMFDPLLINAPARGEEQLIEPLTEREAEVLQLLAQGLANKQIAITLGISEHTVKFHVSGIYAKLGATNRTEAVRLGVRQGLIVL